MSTKEIQYRESATLLCLLAGLSGKIITVEQLNENKITGKIENVDENMTLQLSNVEIVDIEEQVTHFDALQIKGNRIRFIHLPDDIDIVKVMKKRIDHNRNSLSLAKKENTKISKEANLKNKGRLEKESISKEIAEENKRINNIVKKKKLDNQYKEKKKLMKEQMMKSLKKKKK